MVYKSGLFAMRCPVIGIALFLLIILIAIAGNARAESLTEKPMTIYPEHYTIYMPMIIAQPTMAPQTFPRTPIPAVTK